MPSWPPENLSDALARAGNPLKATLTDGERTVPLSVLVASASLGDDLRKFEGRSVLIAVETQMEAAAALIDLDGLARRVLLCRPT